MRVAYFVAGNAWLMFAMFAWLGRHTARRSPTYYTFFDNGAWLSPGEYGLCVGIMLFAAIALFALASRCAPEPRPADRA